MQLRQVRDIEYQLLPGSDRQTTDIVIERDGIITVRPPKRMSPEQVDETVLAKRMWIYRNLADWADLNATRVSREWVSGETSQNAGGLIRWPAYVLIPLGFALLMLQGVSELIKRIAFLTGNGPDVLSGEEAKSDEQKHLEELEAQAARLLAGDK